MGLRSRPESLAVASLIAATGGLLDASTYLARGGVLAAAQTGNVVLLAVAAAGGDAAKALGHVPSLVAFLAGVLLTEVLDGPRPRRLLRRPVRVVLLLQVAVLVAVGFVPAAPAGTTATSVASAGVAFAAALQLNVFRSVRGMTYASTFASGNLRSLVEKTYAAVRRRGDPESTGRQARDLATVMVCFAGGAFAGALATDRWGPRGIWGGAVLLVVVLVLVVRETRRVERG
ncbi:YoaK family protein [Kineococcus sp. NPDC059986]|uniref:YoaK family protein n=1 Tax=Kineococcus sp. NPDC059986 TaxID=3155538 RepID=UPI00344D66CF